MILKNLIHHDFCENYFNVRGNMHDIIFFIQLFKIMFFLVGRLRKLRSI